jgi:hypothetical protein
MPPITFKVGETEDEDFVATGMISVSGRMVNGSRRLLHRRGP